MEGYKDCDYEQLRNDLIEYYGTASEIYSDLRLYVDYLKNASEEEVVKIALNAGINLNSYNKNGFRRVFTP